MSVGYCVSPSYQTWLSTTSEACNASSNAVEEALFATSPYLQLKYISRSNPTRISEEQVRVFVGCAIVVSNLLLLVFLNCRASMRRRYIFFTLVSIGDMLDGSYLIYPSIMRIVEMAEGYFNGGTSLWGCVRKGYVVFRIFGTELVSVTLLTMSLEKICAVLFTVHYRLYATTKARCSAAVGCVALCSLSLVVMVVTSYLDGQAITQDDKYCGISGSTVEEFATFHQFFNLGCQVSAFLGSATAFLIAKSITQQANARVISSIRPILVVSLFSCIVISSNNIIYILKNFLDLNITKTQQNYVVTYSTALFQVSKFALYMLTGQEFRDCLKKVVADKNCTETQINMLHFRTPTFVKVAKGGTKTTSA